MKLKWVLFFFLISFSSILYSQIEDDIKSTFYQLYEATDVEVDSVEMKNSYSEFLVFLSDLKNNLTSKKEKKNLKSIFKKVHNKYFLKYEESPNFSDIFTDGVFNCVTASGLYCIVFDYLEIPYEIRQQPTHIYVVAYPRVHNIIVESTLPTAGVIEYSKKEIENYKKYLVENKVITEEEANKKGFWNAYIFPDSTISKSNLIGIQYYNLTLDQIENEKYSKALKFIEKAKLLNDTEIIKTLYLQLINEIVQTEKFTDPIKVCEIIKHTINIQSKYSEDYIQSYKIFQDLIIESSISETPSEIQSCLACFKDYIKDTVLRKDLIHVLDITTAESYFAQTQLDSSIYYLKKSYDPDKKKVYKFIEEVIFQHLIVQHHPESILIEIEAFESSFSFLKGNERIQSVDVFCYMKILHDEYSLNEKEKASIVHNKFRNKYPKGESVKFDGDHIGSGFGAASAFHVRQNDYIKAIQLLKEGLEYAPSSLELRRKLKLLEEEGY